MLHPPARYEAGSLTRRSRSLLWPAPGKSVSLREVLDDPLAGGDAGLDGVLDAPATVATCLVTTLLATRGLARRRR